MPFEKLSLDPSILKAIANSGYTVPTPIQEQAIPVVMAGSDILASAQTGTGKTAAFTLPALQLLVTQPPTDKNSRGPRILVLTPTRELAMQVSKFAEQYSKFCKRLSVVSILGGVPYFKQRQQMSRPIDIMVATPGRLIDYMGQGEIDFSRLEMLILDEADRMLDMGFRDAVQEIASALPDTRQTLMFSATIDASIKKLAQRLLKNPVRIEVSSQTAKHENIEQQLYYVADLRMKKALLKELLKDEDVKQAIIFTATKKTADELADALYDDGIEAAALHGDLRQAARTRTITALRSKRLRFLVATDVAARGIDVAGISHIFNFDLPRVPEDYVHRIGRTGRAGAKGVAIALAYPKERWQVKQIESYTGQPIKLSVKEGFEAPTFAKPQKFAGRGAEKSGDRSRGAGRAGGNRNSAPQRNDRRGESSKRPAR